MLTPQDVRSVQFEKNLRGYRTEDVDRFLDKVEEQLRDDDAQAEQLRKQIADLTAENQKIVPEYTAVFCRTQLMFFRITPRSICEALTPSKRICPSVGRRKDSSSCTSVLLPLPVPPMMAIFCPGRMCMLTSCTAASDAPAPGDPEGLLPRKMAKAKIGDFCVIGGAGAYCASMCTQNYNSYPAAAEVMLMSDGSIKLIRRRQTLAQILENEVRDD